MTDPPDEEERLRSVAFQNAQSILAARQRAEAALLQANQALKDKNRELARALADQRRAEAELRSQSEWLQVTLSSIGDAVVAGTKVGAYAATGQSTAPVTTLPAATMVPSGPTPGAVDDDVVMDV